MREVSKQNLPNFSHQAEIAGLSHHALEKTAQETSVLDHRVGCLSAFSQLARKRYSY